MILPDAHLGRDAPVGIALILQGLVEKGVSLWQWYQSLPQYTMVKKRVELGQADPKALVEEYRARLSGEKLDLTDGVKVLLENSWVQVRASNTEPIVRVMAEAPTREEAEELAQKHVDLLRSLL